MRSSTIRPALGSVAFLTVLLSMAGYFVFAALQGDYGVFRRIELAAEHQRLMQERDRIAADVARLEARRLRLSDDWLDPDLLDEEARRRLGLLRPDEIVIR